LLLEEHGINLLLQNYDHGEELFLCGLGGGADAKGHSPCCCCCWRDIGGGNGDGDDSL